MRGDLFNANRFYTLAFERVPKSLDFKDIENFVIGKFITLPLKDFLKYCKEESGITSRKAKFKTETSFYCAKALIHGDNYVEAIDFINRVPKSYQRLEYHFLKATLFLKLNKTPQCLEEMKTAESKITDNTSLHFRDLVQAIHARCLLAEGRFAESINKFQTLSANSSVYLTTLEEQAWAHFKSRNFTSARDILKIITSYFTGQDIKNQIYGADVYFRTKYLQAFIELISENREKAKELFVSLKEQVQKFKKDNLVKPIHSSSSKKKLLNLKTYSQLLTAEYDFITKLRGAVDTWSTVGDLKQLDRNLRYLIALNTEIETLRKLKRRELASHLSQMRKLQSLQVDHIVAIMDQQAFETKRNIEAVEFKATMGQVENFWANRTEGKRTLAEVLESYKAEIAEVEEYLGK